MKNNVFKSKFFGGLSVKMLNCILKEMQLDLMLDDLNGSEDY
ncbi:MAG: hypothetical protein WAU11_04650 [Ignavibacteriaceae bacterium]